MKTSHVFHSVAALLFLVLATPAAAALPGMYYGQGTRDGYMPRGNAKLPDGWVQHNIYEYESVNQNLQVDVRSISMQYPIEVAVLELQERLLGQTDVLATITISPGYDFATVEALLPAVPGTPAKTVFGVIAARGQWYASYTLARATWDTAQPGSQRQQILEYVDVFNSNDKKFGWRVKIDAKTPQGWGPMQQISPKRSAVAAAHSALGAFVSIQAIEWYGSAATATAGARQEVLSKATTECSALESTPNGDMAHFRQTNYADGTMTVIAFRDVPLPKWQNGRYGVVLKVTGTWPLDSEAHAFQDFLAIVQSADARQPIDPVPAAD